LVSKKPIKKRIKTMAQYSSETFFQSLETKEILILALAILTGIGLIYGYLRRRKSGSASATKKCAHCAKMIDSDVKTCPLCQRMVL
jgi:hypothetical protein